MSNVTNQVTLTDRQREVLQAIAKPGLHVAVSPHYVQLRAGEGESWQTCYQTTESLVDAGLVVRSYCGSMVELTDAGREQVRR